MVGRVAGGGKGEGGGRGCSGVGRVAGGGVVG